MTATTRMNYIRNKFIVAHLINYCCVLNENRLGLRSQTQGQNYFE